MECIACGSAVVSERSEPTAQGYRRFRCRACGKQFNERSAGSLNRTQYPSDVIALVVLWRLRYKLALRDVPDPRHRLQPRGGSRLGSQAHTGIG
jgi:putative transposase